MAASFGGMAEELADRGSTSVDGVVLDLGVSSFQLDDPARGFSFRRAGPLDMRMEKQGPSAADLVDSLDEAELARLLRRYGDEPTPAASRARSRPSGGRRRSRPRTRSRISSPG